MKGNSKPFVAPELPEGTINLSDPDSRVMRTQGTPPRQAYNAQAAVNDKQIILAAEITVDAPDFGHLDPMLDTTLQQLERQGVSEQPEAVLADAGYWHTAQIESIAERGIEVLVPPDGNMREGNRPGWENGLYELMRSKLTTDRGRELYAQRKITIEPVYGQIKYNRQIDRFMRRGRAAAQSEWRLVAATHILKLHSRRRTNRRRRPFALEWAPRAGHAKRSGKPARTHERRRRPHRLRLRVTGQALLNLRRGPVASRLRSFARQTRPRRLLSLCEHD